MLQKIVNRITEFRQVILYNIPNKVSIDVKIPMRNMVTHALNCLPRNFRTGRKQLLMGTFIDTLNALADCFNQHTISSQRLHASRRCQQLIHIRQGFVPQFQIADSLPYLTELVFNDSKLL